MEGGGRAANAVDCKETGPLNSGPRELLQTMNEGCSVPAKVLLPSLFFILKLLGKSYTCENHQPGYSHLVILSSEPYFSDQSARSLTEILVIMPNMCTICPSALYSVLTVILSRWLSSTYCSHFTDVKTEVESLMHSPTGLPERDQSWVPDTWHSSTRTFLPLNIKPVSFFF